MLYTLLHVYNNINIPPAAMDVTDIAIYNETWVCKAQPCTVYMGHTVSVNITLQNKGMFTHVHITPYFHTPAGSAAVANLTNNVYGIYHGIKVHFPGYPDKDVDVCALGASGMNKCPIAVGATYTENLSLTIIKEPLNNVSSY